MSSNDPLDALLSWSLTFLVITIIVISSTLYGHSLGYDDGYKEGQMDMHLGHSKFVLMQKADQTRYWKKVESYKIYCATTPGEQSWYYWPNEHFGLVSQ